MVIQAEKDNEPEIAEYLMNEYKMIKYMGTVYYKYQNEYINDLETLKRLVFNKVGNQKTRYVDEIIKQIEYRCDIADDTKGFWILNSRTGY